MSQRTAWIIDGGYLLRASPGKFDYLLLKSDLELAAGCTFTQSHYFNSLPRDARPGQDSFHRWLRSAPPYGPQMRVHLYELKEVQSCCPECSNVFSRQVQKGVDVGITVLALRLASENLFDQIVLSAGDGDFADAIDFVTRDLGKKVVVAGFPGSVSPDLQSAADEVLWLDARWDHIKRLAA